MNNAAILALIEANPSLQALANAGEDAALAAAAVPLAPQVPSNYMLTWLEIGRLFGPVTGATLYGALQTANPFVFQLMQLSGVNVSDPSAPAFIAGLVTASLLTQAQANMITALATVPDTIDHNQVAAVLASLRQAATVAAGITDGSVRALKIF